MKYIEISLYSYNYILYLYVCGMHRWQVSLVTQSLDGRPSQSRESVDHASRESFVRSVRHEWH